MGIRTCNVPGCIRSHHAQGFCSAHYQQWRTGRDPLAAAPRPVHAPGWTPPAELSPAWKAQNVPSAPRVVPDRSCALQACAGTAVHGSAYCIAHKAYRDAQARLKARGLA